MIIIHHAISVIHDKGILSRLEFVHHAVIRNCNVINVTTHDNVDIVMNIYLITN
jgi:hypothetical protein